MHAPIEIQSGINSNIIIYENNLIIAFYSEDVLVIFNGYQKISLMTNFENYKEIKDKKFIFYVTNKNFKSFVRWLEHESGTIIMKENKIKIILFTKNIEIVIRKLDWPLITVYFNNPYAISFTSSSDVQKKVDSERNNYFVFCLSEDNLKMLYKNLKPKGNHKSFFTERNKIKMKQEGEI